MWVYGIFLAILILKVSNHVWAALPSLASGHGTGPYQQAARAAVPWRDRLRCNRGNGRVVGFPSIFV